MALKLKQSAIDNVAHLEEYTRKHKKEIEENKAAAAKAAANDDEDDIAPVKTSVKSGTTTKAEKEDDRKWFQKGAFEDGYQFGDITKTIVGSLQDAETNVMAGILGIGEKVVDFGATLYGGAAGALAERSSGSMAEKLTEQEKKAAGFVEKDLYDEKAVAKKIVGVRDFATSWMADTEEDSVFGDKTDSLAQSGGQLLGTVALQAAGVPWWVTTGTTAFGSEAENAFMQGATTDEAIGSSLISAGAEVASEKLFGAIKFGGKTLDDLWVKPLADKISSKTLRTLVNLGVDATGEGFEEVFSSAVSNAASAFYKEENAWELMTNEEAFDEYLESFIGGMALGGGFSGGKAANSIVSGRDYKTGLTENEQKVLDKEIESRVQEETEKKGEELTAKEKAEIEKQAQYDLNRGYISTDTIESTLGGESYKSYQSAVEKENALKEEIEKLENLPKEQITVKQSERLTEAREELAALDNETAKKGLSDEVQKLLTRETKFGTQTDNYLLESYNDEARARLFDDADRYAPPEDIAPSAEPVAKKEKPKTAFDSFRDKAVSDLVNMVEGLPSNDVLREATDRYEKYDEYFQDASEKDAETMPANIKRQYYQWKIEKPFLSDLITRKGVYEGSVLQKAADGPGFDFPVADPASHPAATAAVPTPDPAPSMDTAKEDSGQPKIAEVLVGDESEGAQPKKQNTRAWVKDHVMRKGGVFEDRSLKTGNRELQALHDNMRRAESAAQYYIKQNLIPILEKIDAAGLTKKVFTYNYHLHNIDRMSLETEENRAKREEAKAKLKGYSDKQIEALSMEWIRKDTPQDAKERIQAARDYLDAKKHANKAVFGDSVTADVSRETVKQMEAETPELKGYAEELIHYANGLRQMLVENGLTEQEVAELWESIYPHYVPIRRKGKDGNAVDVPLDTNRTGVNHPVKRATGGNSDIMDLGDTLADRTVQVFRAVARNRFGVELMNTLNTVIESEAEERGILPEGTKVRAHDRENIGEIRSYDEKTGKYTVYFENKKGYHATVQLDAKTVEPIKPVAKEADGDMEEAIDRIDAEEGWLHEGKDGKAPTFTVFVNGKRKTFEITEEMYNSLKPNQFTYTNKYFNAISNFRRDTLTKYSPKFAITNPIKDLQDVIVNSQHPVKTFANIPLAAKEFVTKGKWYQERMAHGGGSDTYFDSRAKKFKGKKKGKLDKIAQSKFMKVVGFPFQKLGQAQEFLEQVPRMAEYIASRKMGRSIDVSMLDAGRVTTNFGAAGDFTNMLNRNGATFLGASVEGFNQQVRNVREAKAEGLKGWAKLAAKYAAVGLPVLLLNHALWDDDEEYQELSDYVKQNYYIVGKFGDGKFVRIPKGRAVAVIQNAFEQMENKITGDDEVDWATFADLFFTNLAPNNPLDNNILSPIFQVAANKTWYGDDLVPTRLQNVPKGEQFDETTDAISRWLGENAGISPIKFNYLLDQYGGALADVALPMITPKAESGDNSFGGKLIAPIRDAFTTDSVLKNQNVSDFYDTVDELAKNANSMHATEEDVLKYKYMNSINSELGELYGRKREIQSSGLRDSEKYRQVREIQRQIDELAKESLGAYSSIQYHSERDGEYSSIGDRIFKLDDDGEWQKLSDEQVTKYKVTSAAGDASYATDGENHYRWYEPGEDAGEDAEAGWRKVTDKELERQEEVTGGLGITPEEYWDNKEEYSYAYDHQENYAVAKAVGGYEAYRGYSSELYDIKADKDSSGKSISGSRKEKVLDYINGLDADYGEKIILFKSEYNADDTYNYEIIDYLNSREDISYEEMETILKKLGFEVDSEGNISW